jgi:glycerophosphoryl diester phosphodiesterase
MEATPPDASTLPWIPQISAHRGGALIWPENSPTVFRRSCGPPVASIETDVHLSRDGRVGLVRKTGWKRNWAF